MVFVLTLIAIFCLGYFICIAFFVGHGTNFYFIWLFLGIGALAFAFLIKRGIWQSHVPLWLRRGFLTLICAGILLFLAVEGCILSQFSQKGPAGLDYLVVLGAQMKAGGPSKALQYRLDEACRYLAENEETKVIVSGGQGPDEPVSEARGMYDYLVEKGIDRERIILEDRSVNTFQNLTLSAEFLEKERDAVGVVSNNFHVFRAVGIARKAGYLRVYGIAAGGEPFLQINNMTREFLGVMKDFLAGNM